MNTVVIVAMAIGIVVASEEIMQESFVIKLIDMKAGYEEVIEKQGIALEEYNQTLQVHGQRLNEFEGVTEVTFWAQLSQAVTIAQNALVIFDDVKTNIGGGYISNSSDPNDSKFIAPVNGTYQFSLVVMSDSGTGIFGRIMKGTDVLCNAYSKDEDDTGICIVNIELAAGNPVWVKNIHVNNAAYHGFYTSFSGFLASRGN